MSDILHAPLAQLAQRDAFIGRHIGPDETERTAMLAVLGLPSLEALIDETIPAAIRLPAPLALGLAAPEHEVLADLAQRAEQNVFSKSLIGQGYYGTFLPPVIQRNVLENPGWYTAYTPYQAEIAQGRLEALLNFQQMIIDLTGLELANASLLDEATAAAEAMAMARRVSSHPAQAFFVDEQVFPQTLDVLRTRAAFFGFELIVGPADAAASFEVFGALLQTPNRQGTVCDLTDLLAALKARDAVSIVACDLLAQVLLKSPGAMGADIAIGSAQRFGVPMGFGGPHAAFFATRDAYKRAVPGRIIGVSIDARGKRALRMALQTREQHIRREKANSNICTSQVLLANIAGFYAVYHGPDGLRTIASRVHRLASVFASGLEKCGLTRLAPQFFDGFDIETGARTEPLHAAARAAGFTLREVSDTVLGVSFDERTTIGDVAALLGLFGAPPADEAAPPNLPPALLRQDALLVHPVFHAHHTEHAMLRYLKRLQNKDLALDHAMISLGSCTMKLNATSEMIPITWPQFADVHPFAPAAHTLGYRAMIDELAGMLETITGFDAVSLQPNSGAQGEFAGLAAIARYHASRGEAHRRVCLIPKSAHGTNPATAQMANMEVVTVACDTEGNVDLDDLRAKAEQHAARLAAMMITYPSTHGVFEEAIREMCAIVHDHGGQVYMDGANLNAQVGLTAPGHIGADVSHINLHKTFCIPHGGGGPGMGPIGLKAHLAPFMPGHPLVPTGSDGKLNGGTGAVSAAPFGSAGILPISWMYIRLMGADGLTRATQVAILNANYVATHLAPHFPVLYTGRHGRVAHECILDIRPIKAATGISEVDIAKRLMDYGFHAPTMSFPVPGTMMVEPTESEPKTELDRFIAAMVAIREEIGLIEKGHWAADDNPLKHAPHTEADLAGEWTHPYSRKTAVFPLPWVAENKFWPSVNRIDDAYGDRNLFCACIPVDEQCG